MFACYWTHRELLIYEITFLFVLVSFIVASINYTVIIYASSGWFCAKCSCYPWWAQLSGHQTLSYSLKWTVQMTILVDPLEVDWSLLIRITCMWMYLCNCIIDVLLFFSVWFSFAKKSIESNTFENKLFLFSLWLFSVCSHNYTTNWLT